MSYVVDPAQPHLGGNIDGGDALTRYPDLWAWLIARFGVRSVFDVGCGQGDSVRAFAKLGCSVMALDGLASNLKGLEDVATPIVCDLSVTSCPLPNIDLVWCCEVVEHVSWQHLDKLLETITCGRVLAMTHAVPGQTGHHHVNCQHASYWIDRIREHGMVLHPEATDASRELAGTYWRSTGMIFVRPGTV